MNTEANIIVKGVDEHQGWEPFEWKFGAIEMRQDGPAYGNGIYVAIIRDGYIWKSLDARYVEDYDFITFLRETFEEYYGRNLRHLTIRIGSVVLSKDYHPVDRKESEK